MSYWYVSPNGSDIAAGSQAAPFATLQRGVDMAQPGDAIVVAGAFGPPSGAMYAVNINKAGSQGAPITLMGQGAVLDGQRSLQYWLNLQAGCAWWTIQGFEILNSTKGGIWANSGGAKNVTVQNCQIHDIGGVYDPSTYGIAGIYTDAGASMLVQGCAIHSIGRTNDAGNSYDHGIYSHGQLRIIGNQFADARSGWHIQTADSFAGAIQDNALNGPNQYPGKAGQVMLWGANGAIDISGNSFENPAGPAIIAYSFSSPQVTMGGNQVSGPGASLGGPAGAINTDAAPVQPAPIYQAPPPIAQTAPTVQFLGPPTQAPFTPPPIIAPTPETFADIWYSDTQEFPFVQIALAGALALYLLSDD